MSQTAVLMLVRWLFAGLAVAALVLYIVRPLLRMVRHRPDVSFEIPDFTQRIEEEELELPNAEEAGFDRNAAITQARADPRATALRVQQWLKEKR